MQQKKFCSLKEQSFPFMQPSVALEPVSLRMHICKNRQFLIYHGVIIYQMQVSLAPLTYH